MPESLRCDRPARDDQARLYDLLISELTDFAVFLMDPAGCLTTWNPGVETLLGYQESEWVGQPSHIIFTPEDRAAGKPEEEMSKAAREGRSPNIRWHQRKDGSWLFVEGTMVALKDSAGTLLGFSKVMRDVTARQQAEEALRASEERLQALVSASSDALYQMNPDWTEMRQLGGGEFLADTEHPDTDWLQHYIHPDDQPRVLEAIEEAVRTKDVFELEHRVRRLEGTLGWTHSRAIPLFDAHGEITEWFGAATDVTARKAAEVERELLLRELARSNEDLSQFAHVASHDLRSPLSTITQFAQLLLKRYKGQVLDEQAEDFLRFVISSAERMGTLTADLLRYAQVSSSPLALATPVTARLAVDLALANLQGEIQESGAVISCEALPELNLESTLLTQIFQNLIGNAIKYRGSDAPRIHIAAEKVGNAHRFSVRDNGLGMTRDQQSRIFEPF